MAACFKHRMALQGRKCCRKYVNNPLYHRHCLRYRRSHPLLPLTSLDMAVTRKTLVFVVSRRACSRGKHFHKTRFHCEPLPVPPLLVYLHTKRLYLRR